MAADYWRIDFHNKTTGEIIKGSIKYASEFKACMEAGKLKNIPKEIEVKIIKCKFNG